MQICAAGPTKQLSALCLLKKKKKEAKPTPPFYLSSEMPVWDEASLLEGFTCDRVAKVTSGFASECWENLEQIVLIRPAGPRIRRGEWLKVH